MELLLFQAIVAVNIKGFYFIDSSAEVTRTKNKERKEKQAIWKLVTKKSRGPILSRDCAAFEKLGTIKINLPIMCRKFQFEKSALSLLAKERVQTKVIDLKH